MAILDLAEVRNHIQTDLPDSALQTLMASAEARIVDWAGSAESPITRRTLDRPTRLVKLYPPAAEITELRVDGIEIPSTAYMLSPSGSAVMPVSPTWWRGSVEVTYTPAARMLELRKSVFIDLIRYAAQNQMRAHESLSGDFSASFWKPDVLYLVLAQLGEADVH